MSIKKYRVVVVMSLIVLGLIPYLIALATDNIWLMAFSGFSSWRLLAI